MAAGLKLGKDDILARNTGSWGSPVWNVVANCRDLSKEQTMDEGDATTRGSGGTKMTEPTLRTVSVDFEMLEDTSDADFVAFLTAYLARSMVDVFCGSGDPAVAGNSYDRFEAKVVKMSKTEPLGDINKYALTLKPCYPSDATHLPEAGITV